MHKFTPSLLLCLLTFPFFAQTNFLVTNTLVDSVLKGNYNPADYAAGTVIDDPALIASEINARITLALVLRMVCAILVSVGIMLLSAKGVSDFVNRHAAVKVLALAFLVMIGTTLIAEGLAFHIPKGYVYVSMLFAVSIEFINIWIGTRNAKSTP